MANGWIQGESISGSEEQICPGKIWEPEQPATKREEIHFTELVKGVSDTAIDSIAQSGGFKGNRKLYNRNQQGNNMYARFSWWSVHIPPDEKERLQNNLLHGEELADIYLPGSRYGNYVFHLDLGKLLSAYGECCGRQPEIRVLGTYVYTREVMHAFVVVPSGDDTFNEHSLVDDDYFGQVPFANHYSWKPFSVIKWNNNASAPKERMWAHQTFAFFLDPLPGEIMLVPEVEDEANWETCSQSGINLVKPLMI